MAIAERIHFFRLLRGMTQKYLGMSLGFPEKSADVRLAQYETGSRTPKADLTAALAEVLDVSPHALSVPDIDSYVGLMHTLFTLEDNYGLKIGEMDGGVCLKVDVRKNKDAARLAPIDGLPPDPTDLPEGCSFSPRCPYATEECRRTPVESRELTPGHLCRCIKAAAEAATQEV